MPADIRDPLIGRIIDRRYEVRSRIARGGMATVYEATDLRLDRTVAIKVMHPHLGDDAQFRDRFIQEAKSAARLAHPNVVNVFDQGSDGETAYLVMEHLPSITLRDLLLERGRITPAQALTVLEAVLAGLSSAHAADIVHRDLKPENILLANDGRIKIGDFGLARAVTANTATGKALLGTIAYLSPELVTRGLADTRSDIYAVGIMLFEMLTGTQPFTGDEPMQIAYQHANGQVPLPSSLEPAVPRELDSLVSWATQRDPNLRPADAHEMLEFVREVRKNGMAPSTPPPREPAEAATSVIEREPAPRTPTRLAPVAPVVTDEVDDHEPATAALQRRATRRRSMGWALAAIVLVLALVAAGLGWWFNLGPGGHHRVPDVAGQTRDAATAMLLEAGIEVGGAAEEPNYDIAAGSVIRTDPAAGTEIANDAPVTLVVSTGRQQLAPPAVQGLSTADAVAAIGAAGFTYDASLDDARFLEDVPAGQVVWARLADGTNVSTLGTVEERTAMGVLVSSGPVPIRAGMTVDDANAALSAVGLASGFTQEHSKTVPAGALISVTIPDGEIRAGATIGGVVSLGPRMVDVPNVQGQSITDAVAAVRAAGLVPDLRTNVPEALHGVVTVLTQDPGPSSVVEGSTVVINASY